MSEGIKIYFSKEIQEYMRDTLGYEVHNRKVR